MPTRYSSGIGIPFALFVGLTAAGVYVTVTTGAWFLIFIPCLTASILLRTHYTVGSDNLKIVTGPISWNIPFHEITDVHTDWTFQRDAAILSLDVVVIIYGDSRSVVISPRDKSRFLRELKGRLPPDEAQTAGPEPAF